MAKNNDSTVYQLKNGRWAYRFSISVDGQKIARRGRTDLDGNPLLTRAEALKARKKAIRMAQLAPLVPPQSPAPFKKTMRDVYVEYREKGCSDRAYNTLRKQDSIWKNHLDADLPTFYYHDVAAANLYACRHLPAKYLNVRLYADERKELCDFLDLRKPKDPYNGHYMWPKVMECLQACGYDVQKKKDSGRNGKWYYVISGKCTNLGEPL